MTTRKKPRLVDAKGRPLALADLEEGPQKLAVLQRFMTADDAAIEGELGGRLDLARFMVYEIEIKTKQGKRSVIGMGINGVRSLFKRWHKKGAAITPAAEGMPLYVEVEYEEKHGTQTTKERYIRALVKMRSKTTEEETLGSAEQAMNTWSYNDKDKTWSCRRNLFWIQTGLTKAQRKGMEDMLDPVKKIDWMYRWHRQRKHVAKLEAQGVTVQVGGGQTQEGLKTALRSRLFGIAQKFGLNTNDEGETALVKRWGAALIGKALEDFSPEEFRRVGDELEELGLKNPDGFRLELASKGGQS